MRVSLLAHTQLSGDVIKDLVGLWKGDTTDGQAVSLMAIRQCYSHKTALEVLDTEAEKYFGDKGKESKRLFKQIVSSGHTSTLEHITFTFAIEDVSRALLAQLTRHRHFSFSVQSQRYVKLSSDSRSGGFDYVAPKTLEFENPAFKTYDEAKRIKEYNRLVKANGVFEGIMNEIQVAYDELIELGIPQEDARSILPNATITNLVMTANLRSLLDFYQKRKKGNGAQQEITVLADKLKKRVIEVELWTEEFFANE